MGLMQGELRGPALNRQERCIGPRTARALRYLLEMTVADVARLAGLSRGEVSRIEAYQSVDCTVSGARRAVSSAFGELGAHWCEAATHGGAHMVYLTGRGAPGPAAIKAALALMPTSAITLARRVERRCGIVPRDLLDAIRGLGPLSAFMLAETIRCLEVEAECYFEQVAGVGFTQVGCPSDGGWLR
jgi:hypothetical protein